MLDIGPENGLLANSIGKPMEEYPILLEESPAQPILSDIWIVQVPSLR
jgi:hypothetical protein